MSGGATRPDPGALLGHLRRGDLSGSTELRLNGLGLTTFPRETFDLADSLEVLDLSHNALTDLPEDLGRFTRLRVLFCSGNAFARLPPVLGDCKALSQIGFRGSGLTEVPAESLPPALRWLTLTDNALTNLPDALGERPRLQKLMLSGNQLTRLPDALEDAPALELLRLAANAFAAFPAWLTRLPKLAWLALAANPAERTRALKAPSIAWSALRVTTPLGEGASGQVFAAHWAARDIPVAVKLYKGAVTSDGLPESEMNACLAAGAHPHLAGAFGRLTGHPENAQGLVMQRISPHWRVLAGPPSLESCSRDVYEPGLTLPTETALRIALSVARGAARLHREGMIHGDLYAHNVLWDGAGGQAVLSDFGAASFLGAEDARPFQALDVRAWGVLLEEMLDLCDQRPGSEVMALRDNCLQEDAARRPRIDDAVHTLETILG